MLQSVRTFLQSLPRDLSDLSVIFIHAVVPDAVALIHAAPTASDKSKCASFFLFTHITPFFSSSVLCESLPHRHGTSNLACSLHDLHAHIIFSLVHMGATAHMCSRLPPYNLACFPHDLACTSITSPAQPHTLRAECAHFLTQTGAESVLAVREAMALLDGVVALATEDKRMFLPMTATQVNARTFLHMLVVQASPLIRFHIFSPTFFWS